MVTLANGAPIRNKAAENANDIQLELMMLNTIPTNPITAAIIPRRERPSGSEVFCSFCDPFV